MRKLWALAIFAAAMGWVEAAVVAYLRALYYPGGFSFPLAITSPKIGLVEAVRELATLLMLGSIAWLAGKRFLERFLGFCFVFGLWDIFYYTWLKVILGWPRGLLDPDVLFLLPVMWTGPWIAPFAVSLVLAAGGGLLLALDRKRGGLRIGPLEWALGLGGAALALIAFTYDGFRLLPGGIEAIKTYVPSGFLWPVYLPGLALMTAGLVLAGVRNLRG